MSASPDTHPPHPPEQDGSIATTRAWATAFAAATVLGVLFAAQEVGQHVARDQPAAVLRSLGRGLAPWYAWALLAPAVLALCRRLPLRARTLPAYAAAGVLAAAVHAAVVLVPTAWLNGELAQGVPLRLSVAGRLAAPAAADVEARLEALARSIEAAAGGAARRVSFRVDGATRVVHADEIDRVEVDEDHLRIHLAGRALRVRETLASLQERLPAGMFVRVHRSHLVNAARVRELRPWFGGDYVLVLADGTEITTGRTHRAEVRRAFVAP